MQTAVWFGDSYFSREVAEKGCREDMERRDRYHHPVQMAKTMLEVVQFAPCVLRI